MQDKRLIELNAQQPDGQPNDDKYSSFLKHRTLLNGAPDPFHNSAIFQTTSVQLYPSAKAAHYGRW
jgi:hypothetical protein